VCVCVCVCVKVKLQGTNGWIIQTVCSGIPVCALHIQRHTCVCIAHTHSVELAVVEM
jgi:ribulose-5-phosphate 4-epimerase/fuculose-1-phosphate aldolase